jgi:uncharacterized protein (DUF362 family)/NAD-dependent dihydropyrimidine dehydrogenase PreA subunit
MIPNLPVARVAFQAVPDYDPARILAAVRACLEPLGGMGAFVRPGQRVLLKPNLLGSFAVERAVTTHPAVVRAAIRLVQDAGGQAMVGDSPGLGQLSGVARACGLAPVLAETGAELVDFSEACEYEAPSNVVARKVTLARVLRRADVVISLPKLKTHAQMTMTGALKNQFGLVPGTLKGQWHFRLQQPEWLAALILDLNRIARPALAIMDAVVAMEGEGPTSGQPRFLGAVMASPDLAALDALACHLIGLDPGRVPLLAAAREQHFGQIDLDQIQVLGADWRAHQAPDFKKVKQITEVLRLVPLPRPVLEWIRRQWTLRPRIREGRCTQCGICEQGCPVSPPAIRPRAAPAERVDDARCIRCYCCHEFCPSHGLELRAPWLLRLLRSRFVRS